MPTSSKKTATKATAKKAPAKKSSVKKAAKKAPAKKAAKKTAKKSSKKQLAKASNDKSFWVNNGEILNDLLALEAALKAMDKAVFSYHVQKGKHDFADWVDSVLCDADCAAALRKTRTPKTAHTVVVRHLKFYEV